VSTIEVVVVRSEDLTVDDAEFQAFVEGLYDELNALRTDDLGTPVIREGTFDNFYLSGFGGFVSEDRRTTIMPLVMAGDFDDATANVDKIVEVVARTDGDSGFEVLVTGQATVSNDFEDLGQDDLEQGEIFGIPVALIILVLVFGTVVAAFVPLIAAIVSIIITLGVTAVIGQVLPLSFFVTNIVFMIGLAVGIDYALFIVARYREERFKGLSTVDAIEKAGSTASRAVLFSGIAVVLGLVGMLLIPFNIFIGIGIGAIIVVITSVLPAVLKLLGTKLDLLSVPLFRVKAGDQDSEGGLWDNISHWVMRYPVVSLLLGGGLLIAAAVPLLNLDTGFAGVSTLPEEVRSRQAFNILDEEFSAGAANPARIVIKGDHPLGRGAERPDGAAGRGGRRWQRGVRGAARAGGQRGSDAGAAGDSADGGRSRGTGAVRSEESPR
jgi:RND superfamily putative drug exporter